jgi:hypothetical protein
VSEYNLTLGQAIDARQRGERVEGFNRDIGTKFDFDSGGFNFDRDCSHLKFRIKPKEPEMVTWYRAKLYFSKIANHPQVSVNWHREKSGFTKHYKNVRVLEWETMEAPANWEDWPDEN